MSAEKSEALAYRRFLSFSSALPTIVWTSPRSERSSDPRGAGSSSRIDRAASMTERPRTSCGGRPDSSSYAITPSE
jgi:hypothetical protein